MNAPQGTFSFPGVIGGISCEYTLQHGISPGVATILCAPSNIRQPGGTLTLRYGNNTFHFANMRIVSSQYIQSDQGQRVQLTLHDRRWKWSLGQISGRYNQRRPDGDVLSDPLILQTEKRPQELAKLCLEAMGERNYNVSAMPDVLRPEVDWDYENPANALQELCDQVGCRIVLTLAGHVRIVRNGVGDQLPPGDAMEFSSTVDPPERPDALIVVGAPIRYQTDFVLEAVGLDTDNKIKPIDDLSYKPTAGWENVDPESMLDATIDQKKARELALATVWKWYRILRCTPMSDADIAGAIAGAKTPLGFVPGYGKVDRLEQILPIETEQVERLQENKSKGAKAPTKQRNKPAEVWGVYQNGNAKDGESHTSVTTEPVVKFNTAIIDTRYKKGFHIDRESGILVFSEPVYRLGTGSEVNLVKPAKLRFRVAFSIKDSRTNQVKRYELERKFARFGTKPLYRVFDDLQLWHHPENGKSTKSKSNAFTLKRQADYYLDALAAQFENRLPASATYIGLWRGSLDGALQSITYRIGPQGATTAISRNDERTNSYIPPYNQRRALEKYQASARRVALLGTPKPSVAGNARFLAAVK